MAFWSGEKLEVELKPLIKPFDPTRIDGSTYILAVGDQVFVTGDHLRGTDPTSPLVSVLGAPPQHTFRIAPGQFAFLLTSEEVSVPANAMALISMRARYKFKGLINVSGFHVDPGWCGKLVFSVYNAGPAEIVVARGDPMFMIVYADLDRTTTKLYNGTSKNQTNIDASLLQNMTEVVFSPQALRRRLDDVDQKLTDVKSGVAIMIGVASGFGALIAILLATIALLPSWLGVVVARTLDAANYEIRQKSESVSPPASASAPGSISTSASTAANVAQQAAQVPSVSAVVPKADGKPALKK